MLDHPDSGGALHGADDSVLIARAADGDRIAFGVLLRRHERPLRAAIAGLTKHAADTDDVMQESALKMWSNLGALDDTDRIRAWMMRIARREALRLVLARRHEVEVSEEHASVAGPDQGIERIDAMRQLRGAIDALPEQQQRCYLLRELHGCSYRDIADRLGLAESTVRGSLAAARRAVSRSLRPLRIGPVHPDSDLARGPRHSHPSPVGPPVVLEHQRDAGQNRTVASISRSQSSRADRPAVRVHVGASGVPTVIAPDRDTATPTAHTAGSRSSSPVRRPGRPPGEAR